MPSIKVYETQRINQSLHTRGINYALDCNSMPVYHVQLFETYMFGITYPEICRLALLNKISTPLPIYEINQSIYQYMYQ